MASDLDRDPRWVRLHDGGWVCPCCGARHGGVLDLASSRPYYCPGGAGTRPHSEVATVAGESFLDADFCVVDRRSFFVRGVLRLPIIGGGGASFGCGCWSSLSKENFERHLDTFESGRQGVLGPWFGWFSDLLEGYPDTLALKCRVTPRDGNERPAFELEPTSRPLASEQHEGIPSTGCWRYVP